MKGLEDTIQFRLREFNTISGGPTENLKTVAIHVKFGYRRWGKLMGPTQARLTKAYFVRQQVGKAHEYLPLSRRACQPSVETAIQHQILLYVVVQSP